MRSHTIGTKCKKCLDTRIVTTCFEGVFIDTICDCNIAPAHDESCAHCKGTGLASFTMDGVEITYNCPTSKRVCPTAERLDFNKH